MARPGCWKERWIGVGRSGRSNLFADVSGMGWGSERKGGVKGDL